MKKNASLKTQNATTITDPFNPLSPLFPAMRLVALYSIVYLCVYTVAGPVSSGQLLDMGSCPEKSLVNSHTYRILAPDQIRCLHASATDIKSGYQSWLCSNRVFRPTMVMCQKRHSVDLLSSRSSLDLEQQLLLWTCHSADVWGGDVRLHCPSQHSACTDRLEDCFAIYDRTITLIYVVGLMGIITAVWGMLLCAYVASAYQYFSALKWTGANPMSLPRSHHMPLASQLEPSPLNKAPKPETHFVSSAKKKKTKVV